MQATFIPIPVFPSPPHLCQSIRQARDGDRDNIRIMAPNRGASLFTVLLALTVFTQAVQASNFNLNGKYHENPLYPRADNTTATNPIDECPYVKVVAGDNCVSLPQKCGNITIGQFQSYNGAGNSSSYNATFCDNLNVDQILCCGLGSEPDFSPKPNPDGSCVEWTVRANDTCTDIGVCSVALSYII
jgi:hypothetical protein